MRRNLMFYQPKEYTSPFWTFKDMWKEVDEAFGRDLENSLFKPAVDIVESEKEYKIKVDLPGINEKDINLSFENGILSLSGTREQKTEEKNEKFHRTERVYGKFERSFSLPDSAVNADMIDAKFTNGVLEVTLPKAEVKKAKQISIKS